ncbi:MAG: hypothetical protein PVI26_05885 [Chitinispirillia bacterium]
MKEIDAMTEAEKAWIIVHKIHELKNLLMETYGEEMKKKSKIWKTISFHFNLLTTVNKGA